MTINNVAQWNLDVDEIINYLPELVSLNNKSILITGAAGLICSSVVDILFRYNDAHCGKIHVYGAGRWMDEMTTRFGDRVNSSDFTFVKYDASQTNNLSNISTDFIIHGASNAFPELVMKEPVETMLSNFNGMKYLLDYAKDHGTQRVLYISSSEVYGKKDDREPYSESEYGYIDLLNARNSYSIGKRATETLCASYAAEYGVQSVIVRPGHIYGPTASPHDNRVSSAWAYDAARGNDIIMKSDGAQLRSYCYCLDCASAILKVLLKGENVHAYNISNPDSIISIKELAEILAKTAGVKLQMELPSIEERKGFNPMQNSSLDSKSLMKLGWQGVFNAQRGLAHTVEILRESFS